jgi:hypothetical protein
MFNLIIVAILAILGAMFNLLGTNVELQTTGIIIMLVSLVWLISSLISNFVYYSEQTNRFEQLHSSLNNLSRYKANHLKLIEDFKTYLGEKYPELEKELFKNIFSNSSDTNILLKYPEIKSSKTLMKLVDKINSEVSYLNSLQNEIEYSCAKIRYYKNSKWEFIKPAIPEKLHNVIYSEIKFE